MSGFVGLATGGGAPVDQDLLGRLTDAMAYCGPDRRDTWTGAGVGLGHALLARDPAAANAEAQPCSLDGRTWVACDARISEGDGAVAHEILRAYDCSGERCMEHLIGDFAFALWDGPRRRLVCARDHFGIMPLYYARLDDGGIVVGNVLHCLRRHPEVSEELDENAVGDFLLFRANRDLGGTIYAGIRAVPPGHALTWSNGTLALRRYWEPAVRRHADARAERPWERAARFAHLLERAVADRLPTGRAAMHLSGGLDSTSVAVTARDVLRRRPGEAELRAYTLVSTGLAKEEQEGFYAGQVAARLGIPIEYLTIDDYMTHDPGVGDSWTFPEPGYIAPQSPEYELARSASGFTRLLLTGMGGDPLLTVEPRLPIGVRGWLDAARFVGRTMVLERRRPALGVRRALSRRRGSWPPPAPPLPSWIEPAFARRTLLHERWLEAWAYDHEPHDRERMLHPVWPAMFAASHPAASGLPLRPQFPYFDLRLVTYVWEVPAYPWRMGKQLLREAMHGRLPEAVRLRPKTPLFDPRTADPATGPRHRLALHPEVQRQRRKLVETPSLDEYVDVAAARAFIDAPTPTRDPPGFDGCIELAHWLSSVQGSGGAGTLRNASLQPEISHDSERHTPEAPLANPGAA